MNRIPAAATCLIALAFAVGVMGCGPATPTPPPSPPAAITVAPASPSPTLPVPSKTAIVETPQPTPPSVTVDPGLLEVLPVEVDGVPLEPDPSTAATTASDPLLAESALSIAVALAIAPGASDSEDLAVASVIRLRPDVFDEAFYQEWRDTYNESACEVADGIASEDDTEMDGRQVHVGICVGGARTYHTYLIDQNFIVSITASGERLFGEQIMATLAG